MAKGKKTSSDKTAEVINAKIANPDLSLRDLEKKTWVSRDANSRILKEELPEVATSSDTLKKLVEDNNKILAITWEKLLSKLVDEEGKIRVDEFIKARDLALKQNKLVEATSPDGEKEIKVTFEI